MSQEDEFGIIGATLANAFHVERVVAHGGFAIVYRGIHGGFRAPIALKCLRIPDGMNESQTTTFLERFREEGELLFRLSAAIPEVVRPLHIDAVYLPSGALMPFLALEWLEGEGLDQVLARNRLERKPGLDLHALVEMLRPVAHALSRAHNFPAETGSVCVVHRDLKPENLFLCNVAGAPAIKILDYGIAEVCSVAQRVSGVRAWRGMNPFTPGYGAPEQWAPDRFGPSGAWTDVWGLALTLTEAMAGKPAIDGDVDGMRRVALDPRRRPTPRSLGCIVSNDVEATFQRALALDPRQRTQDIQTFWSEIETAAGLVSTMAPSGAPAGRKSRRGSQERELTDSFQASIDLDLAVEPESLRGSRLSLPGAPPARPSQSSMAAVRLVEEACEADLPTRDDAPVSSGPVSTQPVSSGPRSVRSVAPPSPRPSYRPDAQPSSARGIGRREPTSNYPDAPPASTRDYLPPSLRGGASTSAEPEAPERVGRASLASRPDSPMSQIASVVRERFKVPAILLGAAIGITLLDLVVVRAWGAPMSLGPIRSFWIAGPLALIGGVLLIWRIVADHEDD